MGLDQFAFAFQPDSQVVPAVDLDDDGFIHPPLRVYQWRKHPDLQGWMCNLWRAKGGDGGETQFNAGQNVCLSRADLDALEVANADHGLPKTTGFFFGESTDDQAAEVTEFLRRARFLADHGWVIYYTSWW